MPGFPFLLLLQSFPSWASSIFHPFSVRCATISFHLDFCLLLSFCLLCLHSLLFFLCSFLPFVVTFQTFQFFVVRTQTAVTAYFTVFVYLINRLWLIPSCVSSLSFIPVIPRNVLVSAHLFYFLDPFMSFPCFSFIQHCWSYHFLSFESLLSCDTARHSLFHIISNHWLPNSWSISFNFFFQDSF